MINEENIFRLEVDPTAKGYMLEAARWGKFLAILGFIGLGLFILIGMFAGTLFSKLSGAYAGSEVFSNSMMGTILFIECIVCVAILFYPVFALFKFSNLIKPALQTANQTQFNNAFRYLKNLFRYYGIMTILFLCIYGVVIIFVLIGISMR